MVEGVVKLASDHKRIALSKLDRALDREIHVIKSRRDEGVASDVAVVPKPCVVAKVVLGGCKISGHWIKPERGIEIRESDAINSEANARVAGTSGVQAGCAVVDGHFQI